MVGFGREVRYLLLGITLVSSPAMPADGPVGTTGLQSDVALTEYSELSRGTELIRRLISPLTALRMREQTARSGHALRDQPVDLATEKFALYVPAAAPPGGYALLVFIEPWQHSTVPSRWIPVLDRHGMIFVSAENSGNDTDTIDRRVPLALAAAQSLMKRYPVDPQLVYVGGFSGGSRVALRVAVGYPDLFRGALLEAGSDPLGDEITIPPATLFRRFQEATRLVYLTGGHDDFHLNADKVSRRSLQDWCVSDIDTEAMPRAWHELADPASLDRALDALAKHTPADPNQLAECRGAIDREMTTQLRQVEELLAGGKGDEARELLNRVDARYGGLAAARSVELAARLVSPGP